MSDTVTLTLANANGASPVERSVPRRLGPVVLECEIGRGAMGVVFRGRHEILGRSVAVKLLLYALRGEEDPHFDRFRGEARMAAAVRHPNLTMIHHADVVDGIPYLVMDYIDGPQLSTLLKQFCPLPIDAALVAALAMTDAVAALHGSGIVHRDIKTKNTLLDRDGHVFVTDFGLALAHERRGSSMTPSGVAGTPTYMAPEMFDGLVSPRSDVYALGITTFELMTGSPPFTGSLLEVQKQHVGSPLPVAALEDLGVTPAIIDVLERATHKNATFRHKSADYYRQALEAVTDEAQRAGGRAVLKDLAARFVALETPPAVDPPISRTPTTTYFDLIGQIAEHKRRRAGGEAGQESVGSSQTGDPSSSGGDVPQADIANGFYFHSARAVDEFKGGTHPVDLPCVKCRYNLSGLNVANQCPECGEPISGSAGPPRLMFANPRWLTRMHRGLTMILAAPAIFIFSRSSLVLGVGVSVMRPTDFVPLWGWDVFAYLFATFGLILATAPDAGHLEERRITVWRRCSRIGACSFVAVLVLWLTGLGRGTAYFVEVSPFRTPGTLSAAAGTLTAAAGLFFWLKHLAGRNHDSKRARNARVAVIFCTCAALAGVLVDLAQFATVDLNDLERGVVVESLRLPFASFSSRTSLTGTPLSAMQRRDLDSLIDLISLGTWLWAWLVVWSFRRLVKHERRLAFALCAPVGESTVADPSTTAAGQEVAVSRNPATSYPDGPNDPRNILRLRRCPQCAYDLAGLPRRYRCPECGFEYDSSMFVLHAWSNSGWEGLFTGSSSTRVFCLIPLAWVLYSCGAGVYERIPLFWKSGSVRDGLWAFVDAAALVACVLLVLRYRKARHEHSGDMQLGFSSKGAWKTSKKGGVGPPEVIPWDAFFDFSFRYVTRTVWHLQLTGPLLRGDVVDGFIECTRREAALVHGEIHRRLRGART